MNISHWFFLLFPGADDRNVPRQLWGERAFDEGGLGEARLYLLTIKMSAPLGSFLNQYLLF